MNNHSSTLSVPLSATRNAVHSSVAVFDVSNRTQIEIRGADRVRFLHSFTSNDIKRLKPGSGCETFVTNLKGKVVAHVYVFCQEDSHWLDGTSNQQAAILSHLGKFILIDDVQLLPRDADRGELFVTGPLATQLLQLNETTQVGDSVQRESRESSIDIRRVDLFGPPGFLMSVPIPQMARVKQGLLSIGVLEGTPEHHEFLRTEAGYPQFGLDFTDDYLAQEVARNKQCISFDKGCYLGQETIARLDALGHTNRELRRIQVETSIVPPAGTCVYDASGGNEVGVITSVARDDQNPDPAQNQVVAIGTLKRSACAPGTRICLKLDSGHAEGTVLSQ